MLRIALILWILIRSMNTWAQQTPTRIFSTNDGLPSNAVYQTMEDNDGFLWVATDQGVARFDGKNFQVFSKDEGVSDNEVLQLVKEKNGRVWIRCFNNSVAFFNPVSNRFEDVTKVAALLGIRQIDYIMPLTEGGIQFETSYGSFCFMEEKSGRISTHFSTDSSFLFQVKEDGTEIRYQTNTLDHSFHIFVRKGGQKIADRSFGNLGEGFLPTFESGNLYMFKRGSNDYVMFTHISDQLHKISMEKHVLINAYYMHNFSGNYLNMFHRTRDDKNEKDVMEVNVYDKQNGRFLFKIHDDCIAFHLTKDRQGNHWLSTLDKGLTMYQSDPDVKQCFRNEYAQVKFFSLLQDPNGILYGGNEKGEIVEILPDAEVIHKVYSSGKIEWQRNIAYSQHKLFSFSDGGIFVNYNKELTYETGQKNQDSKIILTLNDSIILSGSNNGICLVNTREEVLKEVQMKPMIVTALATLDRETIYIGSTNGLSKYHIHTHVLSLVNPSELLMKERIIAICTTHDSLVWIATATNGLLVMRNEQIVGHIKERDGLNSNNTLVIASGKEYQVWLGTNAGICRISYSFKQDQLQYQLQNISRIDGLSEGMINQLLYAKGHLYAATDNGINLISDSVKVPDIPVKLIGVKINQQDTVILNTYTLKADQRNITLQFAGIDLKGYFKHLNYSLDEGHTWANLDGGNLSLELSSGDHQIWVKAVDVNKNIGKQILKLHIEIATPYYKTWWFWTCIMLLIQAGIGYGIYRRQQMKDKEKRKLELAKAHLASLEQQAFTSLMNPHFMFNALNSIQHYINHQDRQNANRYLSDFASLIRKNFEAAQQAFIPLEQEIEHVSLYLRLERMRFNDKFTFDVECSDDLDPDDWMMPTMILQPLVENSILHGIMPSKIAGKLILRLSLQDNDLLLEVIDNGIGLENSRALKQGSLHRSRGMELIYKRLVALSFFGKKELSLQYSVPFNDEANPGNRTSLLIPYDLYQSWKKAQALN